MASSRIGRWMQHVYGHASEYLLEAKMSPSQRLNCQADKLSMAALLATTVEANEFISSIFLLEKVCVEIARERVKGSPKNSITELWGEQVAQALLDRRGVVSKDNFPFVYWEGIERVMISALLALLRLTGFLIGFCISLKLGLHTGHALIAPKLLVGLLGLRGLICCRFEGLTIAVIAMAVEGVVGLVGTTVSLATLTKPHTVTFLRDSTSRAPRCLALRITLGFRPGYSYSSLTFCLELLLLLLNHDLLDGF